ncbi:ElaB/YgaM/YqjD family protein [Hydrogenophaga aquatica]
MPDNTLEPKDKLVADLKVVVADAEELLAATAHQTGEKVAELRERMQENLRAARHKLADAEDAIRAKTREVATATDHYVHEHPWKSIGIAAGAGLIIGLLIGRR